MGTKKEPKTKMSIVMLDDYNNIIRDFTSELEALKYLREQGITNDDTINKIAKASFGHTTAYGYKWQLIYTPID